MTKYISGLVALVVMTAAAPVSSATGLYCSGTVSEAMVYSGGAFDIKGSWRNSYTKICSVDTTWNGITPDTCRSWFAEVQEAVQTGHSITVYYSSLSVDCANLPTYGSSPAPGYVMVHDH
jgi:hypothetical protein